jgi:hypothetical protein
VGRYYYHDRKEVAMATPLMKENPGRSERDRTIVEKRLAGGTMAQIAADVGVCKSTVHYTLNSSEIKSLIEQAQKKLIDDSLQTVVSNQIRKIELAKQILTGKDKDGKSKGKDSHAIATVKDKDILELADKAETRIMQSVGIAPSHTTATVFQQIFNSNMAVISPQVLDMLRQRDTGPVLDIEPDLPDEEGRD